MEAQFIAADPQQRAIDLLQVLMERGIDQISIANAFLTGGGAKFLERHIERLKLPDSFLVVAWGKPTDEDSVQRLHELAPGKVYYHLGSQLPYEVGVGPGLMHSKVIFARAGKICWLWVGSHNLTASALQGINREAAILLTGTIDEAPFQEALAHLRQCRDEAKVFDPANPPPSLHPEQTLIVHAEKMANLKPFPWYVHLRPSSIAYDKEMQPPGAVWLYLHEKGALQAFSRRPTASAAYSGTLTALNFTEHHPTKGIPADWEGADYVIEQHGGIFQLVDPEVARTRTPSQSVFRIDSFQNPSTVWVSEDPRPRRERIPSPDRLVDADPEFIEFFTRGSMRKGKLIHRDYENIGEVTRVLRSEVGDLASEDLLERMSYGRTPVVAIAEDDTNGKKSPFIYRAKYKLS